MLIPLICSQCGGKLEVEDSLVHQSDDIVEVLPDQRFVCPHCGMEYLSGEKAVCTSKTVNVAAGGMFIGGDITATNVVLGDKIEYKLDVQKKPKKWWQFWKT